MSVGKAFSCKEQKTQRSAMLSGSHSLSPLATLRLLTAVCLTAAILQDGGYFLHGSHICLLGSYWWGETSTWLPEPQLNFQIGYVSVVMCLFVVLPKP